jgi:hypothetical protein
MSRATRLRPTRQPSARRTAWTRGDPYVRRLRAWITRIASVSPASETALAVAGPRSQARYPLGETPSIRHRVAR